MRDGIQYFILFLSYLIIIFIKYSSFSLSKFRDLSRTKSVLTVRFILVYDTHCLQRAFHESNFFFNFFFGLESMCLSIDLFEIF